MFQISQFLTKYSETKFAQYKLSFYFGALHQVSEVRFYLMFSLHQRRLNFIIT